MLGREIERTKSDVVMGAAAVSKAVFSANWQGKLRVLAGGNSIHEDKR